MCMKEESRNDWTALLTGRKNVKQITLGMVIHRLTARKECFINGLHRLAEHSNSYNDHQASGMKSGWLQLRIWVKYLVV